MVFVAMFALDFVWAFYTKAIQRHAATAAASWAVGIILFSGFSQIAYTHEPWLLLPAALGAFAGTFIAVLIAKKNAAGS
jgi:hypothetical protein